MIKKTKLALSFVLYYLGFFKLESLLFGRRKAKIISFHRVLGYTHKSHFFDPSLVVTREIFESFVEYLSGEYNLISLDESVDHMNKKQLFSRKSCVLTFDDGYRDNYLNAYSTLKNFNVPATIFMTVNCIGKDKAFWQELLFRLMCILYEKRNSLDGDAEEKLSCMPIRKDILLLFKNGERFFGEITSVMVQRMKGLPMAEIQVIVNELLEIIGEKESGLEQGCEFLSWQEIKEMSQNRIDFGSHTLSHAILTVESEEKVKTEVEESKQILEKNLGKKIKHFAYPNGDSNAFVQRVVENSGFVSASSISDGLVGIDSSPYQLSRNCIHDDKITDSKGEFSPTLFELETSFIVGTIRRWLKAIFLRTPPKSLASSKSENLKRKIKILYIIGSLGHGKAGTEGHLITVLDTLDRKKFEPYLCCLNASSWLEVNRPSCPTIVLDFKGFHHPGTIFKILKLRNFIRRQGIDLVQTFFVDSHIIGTLASSFTGNKKMVSSRRDLGYAYLTRELLMLRLINPFAVRLLGNSRAVKTGISQKEKLNPDRMDLIYNGVNLEEFDKINKDLRDKTKEKLNLPDGSLVVGLVANLRPIKNIELFIESASLVSQKMDNVYFMIVGQGPSMDNLKKLSQKLKIEDRVIFVGHCNDIIPYLSIFDIGVLSSDSEGFSNSILEYMAASLPVVATEVGGNEEAIEHNQNGFLVKPKNPEQMSKRIIDLLTDNRLREQMGVAGRKKVEDRFTLSYMMNHLEKYYYSLVANS